MEAISASDDLIRYTFSVDNAKTSAGGFGRRLFWALTGGIRLVIVPKICRYRSITGGKVGSGCVWAEGGEGDLTLIGACAFEET
jgi:hypothetical protein